MKEEKSQVSLIASTNKIDNLEGAKKFCQDRARTCYSGKSLEEIKAESYNEGLIKRLEKSGHHSPFDHFKVSLELNFPKAFMMLLNNERNYDTGEKSARYTKMENVAPHQKRLYNKWLEIFKFGIKENYPEESFPSLYKKPKNQEAQFVKLAQENARYLTSVFTPTRMEHTISLRQLNVVSNFMKDFVEEHESGSNRFKSRLADSCIDFLGSEVVRSFSIPEIKGKANRQLGLFGERVEEIFGKDIYSANQEISFACFAQLQRHRTLGYHINEWEGNISFSGLYIPPMVSALNKESEWIDDISDVSTYDFPQGQKISVSEMGQSRDLYAKTRERICGQTQLEAARATVDMVNRYARVHPEFSDWKLPDCAEGPCEKGGCIFGKSNHLERLI